MTTFALTLLTIAALAGLALFAFGAYRAWKFRRAGGRGGTVVMTAEVSRTRFLGKTGVAVSPLRPAGVVLVGGSRLEATTEGEFVAAGSRVKVGAMGREGYVVRLDADARDHAAA